MRQVAAPRLQLQQPTTTPAFLPTNRPTRYAVSYSADHADGILFDLELPEARTSRVGGGTMMVAATHPAKPEAIGQNFLS